MIEVAGQKRRMNRNSANFDEFLLKWTSHREHTNDEVGHTTIFCDYETGEWNYRQFITWFSKHLISFALTPSEAKAINDENAADKLERAATILFEKKILKDDENDTRGEIGELLLHGVIKDVYKTTPLISKIYYKTAASDKVKGADAVHAIFMDGKLESLWLGEAKFYKSGPDGIAKAAASISDMLNRLSNRKEFTYIQHHLDESDQNYKEIERQISKAISLDEIKSKICVPVLVTYESKVANAHTSVTEDFIQHLEEEVSPLIEKFINATKAIVEVDLHIFLVPIKDKGSLIEKVDKYIDGKKSIFDE